MKKPDIIRFATDPELLKPLRRRDGGCDPAPT